MPANLFAAIRPKSLVVVGANHAGEFIRGYSPDVVGRRRGESCRRIHSPLFAPCPHKISWDNRPIVSLAGVGRIVGVW